MGSMVSVPKISTTPTKTYSAPSYSYTAPTPTSRTGSSTTSSSSTDSTSTSDSASSTADTSTTTTQAARESNLLRRGRGVAGTIRTGFRGLLGIADDAKTKRKTLLGE